jgi:hypothetical protein
MRKYGVSLAVLGSILLFARLGDAFIDPLIGPYLDKTFTKGMQMVKTISTIAVILLIVGFFALWQPWAESGWLLWLSLTLALLLTCGDYSILAILQQVWGTRWGGDRTQREDAALRTIEQQMMTVDGTRKVLQAGGNIAAMQVEQLQKLRQLMMAQIQIQSTVAGSNIDRQAEDDADLQRLLTPRTGLNDSRNGGRSTYGRRV